MAPANSSRAVQPAVAHPPKTPSTVLAEQEAQWIFTEEELTQTPSVQDGMTVSEEHELRVKGLNFILQTGHQLKLPQLTLYSAGLFFNRFLMRHSLVKKQDGPKPLHHYQIAAVALFLSTKTDESVRKMRDIIVACCRVAQKNPNLVVDENSKDFWRWRDTILLNEDIMLETLCFDLSVDSPHKLLFDLLKILGQEHNKKLRNAAWSFVSDSGLTTLCLLFTSRTIAVAAVYTAAKYCGTDTRFLDDKFGKPWWKIYNVRVRDLLRACNFMAHAFKDKPVSSSGGEGTEDSQQSIYVPPSEDEMGARSAEAERLDVGYENGRRSVKRESEAPPDGEPEAKKPKKKDDANGTTSAAGSEEGEVEE